MKRLLLKTLKTKRNLFTFSFTAWSILLASFAFVGNSWGQVQQVFSYTGANQTWSVPAGVTSVTVKLWGAGGGSSSSGGSGGSGAFVKGTLAVTPGQTLYIVVGRGGTAGSGAGSLGYGGGGQSGKQGGDGGGYSGIFFTSVTQASAKAIAGAGGGGGYYGTSTYGGAGGGTDGGNYNGNYTGGVAGGSQGKWNGSPDSDGQAGSALQGGSCQATSKAYGAGGGGGGYNGGGSGYTSTSTTYYSSGGGGGSSYTGGLTGVTNTTGSTANNGAATQAPGNAESGYIAGIGNGGSNSAYNAGGNGLIIIEYCPTVSATSPVNINCGNNAVLNGSASSSVVTAFSASTVSDFSLWVTNGQWSVSSTSNAGGTNPELMFTYISNSSADYWVKSPLINATAFSTLNLSFKHMVNHYSTGYTISVETSPDGATWTSQQSWSPTGNISATTVNITLNSLAYTSFYLRYRLTGNSYNINYWYVDDINITGNSPSITWSGGPIVSGGNTLTPTVNPTVNTTYTMTANYGGGCQPTATVNVTVNPVTITGPSSVCIGSTIDLNATGEWASLPTGGTVTTVGNDKVHTFTTTGTFNTPVAISTAKVLVVGGGGGGGGNGGGGGGAGGVYYNSTIAIASGSTTATVGAGGTPHPNTNVSPTVGGTSSFGSYTAGGGGGGASRDNGTGGANGAGTNSGTSAQGSGGAGGGATGTPRNSAGTGTYNGGAGTTPDQGCLSSGGGGGGAGAAGTAGTATNNPKGGNGGAGISNNITGTPTYYGGGGGGGYTGYVGCGSFVSGTYGTGGSGIGGSGATAPTANSGSGGGQSYTGATGVVIIRYTAPTYTVTNGTGSATINALTGVLTPVTAGTVTVTFTSAGGCAATQVVTINPTAAVASVTAGTTPQCVGATTTYTANGIVLGGGTGAWSSSNTAVATVNATTGVVTAVGAGTCNIIYTITGGCGGTVSKQASYTVNAPSTLPTSITVDNNTNNCWGREITLTATGGVLQGASQYIYGTSIGGTQLNTGTTSTTQTTVPTGSATYYVGVTANGACAAQNLATGVTVNLPTKGSTLSGNESATCYVSGTNPIHFYNTGTGNYIGSINPQGRTGTLTMTAYTGGVGDNTMYACNRPTAPQWRTAFMERSFTVIPTGSITGAGNLDVYFPFTATEYSSLQTKSTGTTTGNSADNVSALTDLVVTKYSNPGSENGTPYDNCSGGVSTVIGQNGNGGTLSYGVSPAITANYIRVPVSSFSEFYLHGQNNASPLPITLTSFSGNCEKDGVHLAWVTATETNVNHFEVERSRNGQTWEVVATVNAVGNSSTANSYQAIDANGFDMLYYRLRSIDNDGTSETFNPIAVACEVEAATWNIHPIPVSTKATITINATANSQGTLVVSDINGRTISSQSVQINEGINNYELDVQHLSEGTYFIRLEGSSTYKPLKFMKMN